MDDALTKEDARLLALLASGNSDAFEAELNRLDLGGRHKFDHLGPYWKFWRCRSNIDDGFELSPAGWAALKRYTDECSSKKCVT